MSVVSFLCAYYDTVGEGSTFVLATVSFAMAGKRRVEALKNNKDFGEVAEPFRLIF